MADQVLVVRTGTPDLEVARDCLVLEEYGDVSLADARFVIDAGAHIGASAIYFAKRFPTARIVAIEPDDDNFALLVENSRPYENVVPIQAALWSVPGERALSDRGTGNWGYTVAETDNETRSRGQLVECVTIPSLLASFDFDSVDILKMDIEGGEHDVLNSSSDWIDDVRVVTLELHDRIVPGCSRALYLATRDFDRFEFNGEKVTAYR
jgi:FkbM family methyltransferase